MANEILKDEQLTDAQLDNVAGGTLHSAPVRDLAGEQLILHLANTAALANENDPSKKLAVGSDKLTYSAPRR